MCFLNCILSHVANSKPDLEESDDDISEIQLEIAHLAQCNSEYVTRYYGSFVKGYDLWIGAFSRSRFGDTDSPKLWSMSAADRVWTY